MSKQKMQPYSAEFKERAVKLAIESDQTVAQTARDLGSNENTLHTWLSKYNQNGSSSPRQANSEHLDDELKRLKKENALLKEERDILKNYFGSRKTPLVIEATPAIRLSWPCWEERPSAYWWR